MSDTATATWDDWIGADIIDVDGDKIGTLDNVFMDRSAGQPEWLLVRSGLFAKTTFVPLQGAEAADDGLRVPYSKDLVRDAPNVDDEDGYLPPDAEAQLYGHYGRDYQAWSDDDIDIADPAATAGRDTSGLTTDTAMTRSEEELHVSTRDREVGRVRLRKYVVTENVTTTVPVRREKVRIEREPITDDTIDQALDGPDISEEEHEVILHAEEPVVDKQVVAKERVRLDTDTVIEDETITDEVRKEQIDIDGDTEEVR